MRFSHSKRPLLRPGRALVAAAALTSGLTAGCDSGTPDVAGIPPRSNILLVTIDTLRADHLSSYGYPRQTSPTIDRLAAEGVRFDQASVQWPKTGPSFASIFTATYARDHKLIPHVGIPVPSGFRMLAEELWSHGYATHAVVANGALGKDFNFHQGFSTYLESWNEPLGEGNRDATGAGHVTSLALATARELDRDTPFLLWVHYLDPHFPYSPPDAWRDRFQGDAWYVEGETLPSDPIGRKRMMDGVEETAFYRARYDAEIAYADSEIQRLLDELARLGLMERTLTVLTSDHGESLGEHDYYFDHGALGYQTCLRVPLIFHYPGILPAVVDPDPVELLHLAPTLLRIAQVPLEDASWMRGRSLHERLLGRESTVGEPLLAFSQSGGQIVRDLRFKLIRNRAGDELYDLDLDPGELVNAVEEFPAATRRLRKALTRWRRAERIVMEVDTADGEAAPQMSEDTREQLRALGYIQ